MSGDKRRGAPHTIKSFKRDAFYDWLEQQGATVKEPTNPFEVARYVMWVGGEEHRPRTHIVYVRKDGTLTYTGTSRRHYEMSGL